VCIGWDDSGKGFLLQQGSFINPEAGCFKTTDNHGAFKELVLQGLLLLKQQPLREA
jgi:hypothetical protein